MPLVSETRSTIGSAGHKCQYLRPPSPGLFTRSPFTGPHDVVEIFLVMESYTGRGQGKLILMGEHAVVYGKRAIGTHLSRGIAFRLRALARPPAIGDLLRRLDDRAREAYLSAAREAGVDAGRFRPAVTSRLPVGQGLGSSAAFSVAASRALLAAAGREAADAEVLELAGVMERVFHGTPSGIDAAMALGRGPVIFARGVPPEALAPGRTLALVVLLSGTSPSTRIMVENVRRRYDGDPRTVGGLIDAAGDLVLQALEAIRRGALEELGRAMNENHAVLTALGVSTPVLDRLVEKARRAGALGAKLTGGGGGGAVVALAKGAAHAGEIRKKLNMGQNSFITIIEP